ncbi:MAG: hypothetical protein Q8P61_03545, partial [Candidatus Nanopelagicales bacterium]|nr:hypothetical protein [Candidatus Nanopelagicales bacterium]
GNRKVAIVAGVLLAGVAISGCARAIPGPAPEVSVDVPGGSGSFSGGDNAKLPAEWPSDVPAPAGLKLEGTASIAGKEGEMERSMTATYTGPGNLSEISAQLSADFKKAGYTSASQFESNDGGMVMWEKGPVKVTVITSVSGGNVSVSETVLIPRAS